MAMSEVQKFCAIPWEDVIYEEIFSRLSLQDLVNLQRANPSFEEVVRKYIETFKFIKSYYMKDIVTKEILKQTKSLISLHLDDLDWLTDSFLDEIIANNEDHLKTVKISGCNCITSVGLRAVLRIRNLRRLDLSNNPSLNDDFLKDIGDALPNLEYVDFSRCSVSDEGLTTLYQQCERLKSMLSPKGP